MNTSKRINAATLLAAASMAFSPSAWSLGLGNATVESFLNQPLAVRIDLLSRETDDLTSISARLASAADYELIGADRESVSVPIRFSVEDIEGAAYLMATSDLPVSNPVIRLIVEVNWSSGRLLREYTVFLDPPAYSEPAPVPRVDMRKSAPAPAAAPAPQTREEPVAASQESAEQPVTSTTTAPRQPAAGEYGPVGSGETLWGIASNWSRGTGLDINRVMIAIQRENPEAFLRNNINLLKRGAILRMPRAEDVATISTATAIDAVAAQEQQFLGRQPAGPATSPSTPLIAEETASPPLEESSPQMAEAGSDGEVFEEADLGVEDQLAEAADAEEVLDEEALTGETAGEAAQLTPQLELVPPSAESDLDSAYGFEESDDEAADATVAISALREDLARAEEELITQQQQNEYLAERIAELESQLESAEQGNVEDSDMANMEERLRQERLADSAADEDAPWYSRLSSWLIGLLVLAAAVAGWRLSRRGAGDEFAAGAEDGALREIQDEAEEVLRVLGEPDAKDVPETATAEATDDAEAGESAEEADSEQPEQARRTVKPFGASGGDAEVLDEESSDPEIQLDLARAYISMGDKEAARVILEEVENNGTPEQQEEARKMLNQLTP